MSGSPSFSHLRALTDERGIFEHALGDRPRREHGYCVDDVSRALIVVVREPNQKTELAALMELYLGFLEDALATDGTSRNRMSVSGEWQDEPGVSDCWGRSVWALGVASVQAPDSLVRGRALSAFRQAAQARSPHLHAMTFAALGAIEVALGYPDDDAATRLLHDAVSAIPTPSSGSWPWPEPRLRYANGAIAEALIGAGQALVDPGLLQRGLDLLEFLLGIETAGDHLSMTGSAGRSPGEVGPLFDQQPIEVAALVDACARAHEATRDDRWLAGIRLGSSWFRGNNDTGVMMFDGTTGAGYDGLEPSGRNDNRGAESTLAALSVYQQNRRIRHLSLVDTAR